MNSSKIYAFLAGIFLVALLGGCESFDGLAMRREHAEGFVGNIDTKTEQALADYNSLKLDDCIRIALENNLSIKVAEIQGRVATLEKNISFANFLPAVSLDYSDYESDPERKIKFGGEGLAMSDKHVRELSWEIQMSIFNPMTWFLYSMHRRGEEAAELVTECTRQMAVLEVTARYFQCLSLGQSEQALESRIGAVEVFQKDVQAFYAEGIVSRWQALEAQVALKDRRNSLRAIRDEQVKAKARLLAAMGLSPLRAVVLSEDMPLEKPAGTMSDHILEALLKHPRLAVADRQIAIEKDKVKIAIANFLPSLVGFATRTNTSDSHLMYRNYWAGGLIGTLSIFDGFANINSYKAAKKNAEAAFIRREQDALTLMLEIVKADLDVKDSEENMSLAEITHEAAAARYEETRARWEEGLVDSAAMLDVLARKDSAQAAMMNARYRLQVSIATLLNVMGRTDTSIGSYTHDH